ncbi:MAG: hypothetical protein RL186_895, partial [Pseudomonadota bacterium]
MEEGVLAKWLVKVGDTLKSGDVMCEIETDKATMEVEAVDEGVVLEILVAEGTSGVKVNAVIARIGEEGETVSSSPAPAPAPASPKPAVPEPVAEPPIPAPAPVVANPPQAETGSRIIASPLAKRLAQEAGIDLDLAAVTGSGPHGRIVKADVEGAKANPVQTPLAATSAQSATPPQGVPSHAPVAPTAPKAAAAQPLPYAAGSYNVIPLDGMRRTIARRMTESFRDVPHFPLNIDLEIDALLALRKQLNVVGQS